MCIVQVKKGEIRKNIFGFEVYSDNSKESPVKNKERQHYHDYERYINLEYTKYGKESNINRELIKYIAEYEGDTEKYTDEEYINYDFCNNPKSLKKISVIIDNSDCFKTKPDYFNFEDLIGCEIISTHIGEIKCSYDEESDSTEYSIYFTLTTNRESIEFEFYKEINCYDDHSNYLTIDINNIKKIIEI
jgi:hypothetical protein